MAEYLDFKYTCPRVDKNIDKIKQSFIDFLEGLGIEDASTKATELYDEIEENIEDMREINIEMRASADKQIKEISEEYETTIKDLQDEVQTLTEDKEKLQEEIDRLCD